MRIRTFQETITVRYPGYRMNSVKIKLCCKTYHNICTNTFLFPHIVPSAGIISVQLLRPSREHHIRVHISVYSPVWYVWKEIVSNCHYL